MTLFWTSGASIAVASPMSFRLLRSCLSVARETFHPSPRFPMIQSFGVLASVRKTSLKPRFPVICLSGRTSIPGCFMRSIAQ